MGVLNVTPDSFSDGGAYLKVRPAIDRAKEMIEEGADLIDIGGESTRPGAEEISEGEEINRLRTVVGSVARLGVPISVDTRRSIVAKTMLDAGASMVNDVSGGTFDPAMLPLVAGRRVPIVLMHMRGTPKTMDSLADYEDVVVSVKEELSERVAAAKRNGVDPDNILLDPGLGFAKTPEQSLELLRRIDELKTLGYPVVVGPSRKRFIGHVLETEVDDRLEGTLAACAWCATHGVRIVRVHDVQAVKRVVDMIEAIQGVSDGA